MEQEDHNHDTVAILKSGEIVSHVPHEIAQIIWYFIEHNGTVSCKIIGPRKQEVALVASSMPLHYVLCKGG